MTDQIFNLKFLVITTKLLVASFETFTVVMFQVEVFWVVTATLHSVKTQKTST
jgi:hypothetical protein